MAPSKYRQRVDESGIDTQSGRIEGELVDVVQQDIERAKASNTVDISQVNPARGWLGRMCKIIGSCGNIDHWDVIALWRMAYLPSTSWIQ